MSEAWRYKDRYDAEDWERIRSKGRVTAGDAVPVDRREREPLPPIEDALAAIRQEFTKKRKNQSEDGANA